MPKPIIAYADFAKLDLRIGTILMAEEISGSEKLFKFLVDLGPLGQKTILSGIKKFFKPDQLVGLQVLVLVNLEPKKMMGEESQGMILMGVEPLEGEEKITMLVPQTKVPEGTGVE